MHVYISFNEDVKRVPSVTLHRCFRPCVGPFSEHRIEPALWYKVMVLDSVLIDCDKQTVYWNSVKDEESYRLHGIESYNLKIEDVIKFFKGKDQIYKDRQFYDFDPTVDELFETSRLVLETLNPDLINKEGNETTYEHLLKLLHVFILPEIEFHEKDRSGVATVLHEIEKQHEYFEEEIQKKDKTKRNTENSLWKQRQNILRTENFSSTQYISGVDDRFLKIFLKHIEKDIHKLNEELVRTGVQVTKYRFTTVEKEIKILDSARAVQAEVLSTITKFTVAREEIKNVLYREHVRKSFRRTRHNTTDFHLLYIEVDRRLQTIGDELKDLINSKIKISSVREAALLTLKELDSDGSSFGYNRKKGNFEIETDLFDPTNKPEAWTTLAEKVTAYVSIKQLGFMSDYDKFCDMILRKCESLVDESKVFAPLDIPLSPTAATLLNTLGAESQTVRQSRRVSETPPKIPVSEDVEIRQRTFSTRWSMGSISRSACEQLCREIIDHISDMAFKLAIEISAQPVDHIQQSLVNKIYTCYEQHVSERIMSILCDLYEKCYKDQCFGLAQWITQYTASEVGFGEKTMQALVKNSDEVSLDSLESSDDDDDNDDDDELLKKMPLQPSNHQATMSKTCTLSSRSLKRMPWNELYSRMNQQHESMAQSFVGALDMDAVEYSPDSDSSGDAIQNNLVSTGGEQHVNAADASANEAANDSFEHIEISATQDKPKTLSKKFTDTLKRTVRVIKRQTSTSEETHKKQLECQGATGDTLPVQNGHPYTSDCPPEYSTLPKEVVMRNPHANQEPPPYSTLPPLKERFYEVFSTFFTIVHEESLACSLFNKLRTMTRAIKFIETQMTKQRAERSKDPMVCSDDLLDVVILLLCKLDADSLLKFYAHLNLMIHLSPSFMHGNAHDYSLVTISVAYQHLFEQQVLSKQRQPLQF